MPIWSTRILESAKYFKNWEAIISVNNHRSIFFIKAEFCIDLSELQKSQIKRLEDHLKAKQLESQQLAKAKLVNEQAAAEKRVNLSAPHQEVSGFIPRSQLANSPPDFTPEVPSLVHSDPPGALSRGSPFLSDSSSGVCDVDPRIRAFRITELPEKVIYSSDESSIEGLPRLTQPYWVQPPLSPTKPVDPRIRAFPITALPENVIYSSDESSIEGLPRLTSDKAGHRPRARAGTSR